MCILTWNSRKWKPRQKCKIFAWCEEEIIEGTCGRRLYVHMIRISKICKKGPTWKKILFLNLFLIKWNTRMTGTKQCYKITLLKTSLICWLALHLQMTLENDCKLPTNTQTAEQPLYIFRKSISSTNVSRWQKWEYQQVTNSSH